MSWIAGLDIDTKAVHCVLVDEDYEKPPRYERWELEGHDAWERTRNVRASMPDWSWWWPVMAIGVENVAGRGHVNAVSAIQRTTGAVLACLPTAVLVQPWRPAEWRKSAGLPGNCNKAVVAEHAIICAQDEGAEWTLRDDGQDCLDAYCIALATRSALRVGATDTGREAA